MIIGAIPDRPVVPVAVRLGLVMACRVVTGGLVAGVVVARVAVTLAGRVAVVVRVARLPRVACRVRVVMVLAGVAAWPG